jgi:SAM-dependent methyltransferase
VILDAGCATGAYVDEFLKFSDRVFGVEHERSMVEAFKARGVRPDAVAEGDIQRLDFPSDNFDVVLLNEVLEHVPDDRQTLAELFRVMTPGGTLALFSPNRLYPFEQHGVVTKRGGRSVPFYVPFVPYIPLPLGRRVLRYLARNFFPWELRRLVEEAGFVVVSRTYLWQTFEGQALDKPTVLERMSPALRRLSWSLERVPFIRCFGVSQVIFATKSATPRSQVPSNWI